MPPSSLHSLLLVHSPLVGPGTLQPLAGSLAARGFEVLCPDLRGAETWSDLAAAAVVAAGAGKAEPNVVIGHSGAGAIVPAVGAAIGAQRIVFVDAVLPPESGNWEPVELVRTRLETMGGPERVLPAWNTWWNPNMMRRLVPDDSLRSVIEAECRPVPLTLYDSVAKQPVDWSSPGSCVYIRLSGAYVDEIADARARGWAVVERDGHHLDTATRPTEVADLIERSLETTRVRVGDIASLRRRGGVTVPRSAPGVLVVAPPDSGPFAVFNQCAHQGAALVAGYVSATCGIPWIECPQHSWRFDLATGVRLVRDEPSTDPSDKLTTVPCAVDRDGMIWVEVSAKN